MRCRAAVMTRVSPVADRKGVCTMKRFSCLTAATFAVLIPAFAIASPQVTLVYRPELRSLVPVSSHKWTPPAPLSVSDQIARYEARARALRVLPNNRSGWTPATHYEAAAQRLRTGAEARTPEPRGVAQTK